MFDIFNPASVLAMMRGQHQGQQETSQGRGMRVPLPNYAPGEFEEIQHARKTGTPTLWGKIMQRRHGGIQGRGIAGALGKSGMPTFGGQVLQENQALADRYGTESPAVKALMGLK